MCTGFVKQCDLIWFGLLTLLTLLCFHFVLLTDIIIFFLCVFIFFSRVRKILGELLKKKRIYVISKFSSEV